MPRKTNIGRLQADLNIDVKQFVANLDTAAQGVTRFSQRLGRLARASVVVTGIAAVGGAISGLLDKLDASVRQITSWGATLVEQAAVTGLTANQLDLMRRAFESNGASIATVDKALAKFNRRLEFAAGGQQEYLRVFRQLGLDPSTFGSTIAAFDAVFEKISELNTESERGAVLFRLFGDSAVRLHKTFKEGPEAFRAEIERLREIGETADSTADKLKALAQTYTDIDQEIGLETAEFVAKNQVALENAARLGLFFKVKVPAFFGRLFLGGEYDIDFLRAGPREAAKQYVRLNTIVSQGVKLTDEQAKQYVRAEQGLRKLGRISSATFSKENLDELREYTRILDDIIGRYRDAQNALSPVEVLLGKIFEATEKNRDALAEANLKLTDSDVMDALVEHANVAARLAKAEREAAAAVALRVSQQAAARADLASVVGAFQAADPFAAGTGVTAQAARAERERQAQEREERARAIAALELRLAESVRQENIKYLEEVEDAWENVSNTIGNLISRTRSWGDLLRNIADLALRFGGYLAGGGEHGIRGFFGFPGLQYGGPAMRGQPYIVGEAGPELFVPNVSGRVVPNNQLASGATNVNITFQGADPNDYPTFSNNIRRILPELTEAITAAQQQRPRY